MTGPGAPPRARASRAWAASALFALALLLRLPELGRAAEYTGDEVLHVPNAYNYTTYGHLGPDRWHHPPLKHLLTRAGIALAGDNPWGWRLRNVLAGAGSVAVLFLLADALFGSAAIAWIAALLLAFDPLHLVFSRSTYEDVPASLFLMLGALLAIRHHRRGAPGAPIAAGLAFGVAVALRTYAAAVLLAVAAALAADAVRRRRPAAVLDVLTGFGLVPCAVFLLPWIPWFRRGYGFGEWVMHQRLALTAAATVSDFDAVLFKLGTPARWFLSQVGVSIRIGDPAGERFLVIASDLPVWILVLPAMAYMAFVAWRERRWEVAAVPAAFALLYVPFLLADRPIFLYSALAVLPVALLGVAFAAGRILRRGAPAFAAAAVLWGLYLRPLAVAAPIDRSRYEAVLERVELIWP